MKEEKMNVEALSRAELLTLLSVLEGELEAQDVVIHTLRAQHRDSFIQERYGHYNLSDPFLALQRDSEAEERQSSSTHHHSHNIQQRNRNTGPNPLTLIKLVMTNCKRMQERMLGQLAAVESRHRKVISELEEEKLRRLLDCAQNKDFAAILQTERDALLQQLELERAAVRRLEMEQSQLMTKIEDLQREQLSSLSLKLQRATSQAEEQAQNVSQLRATLQKESAAVENLQKVLETERSRADQLEAKSERQQADFDMEREQMKARIIKEEERSRELEKQLEELRKRLTVVEGSKDGVKDSKTMLVSTSVQTVLAGKEMLAQNTSLLSKINEHHGQKEIAPTKEIKEAENGGTSENDGGEAHLHSPLHANPQSPSSPASCSLSSSPISSPVLTKRPGFHQPSYQAGVNQRFQAARHKFQSQAELDQQQGGPLSPRDLSPTTTLVSPPPEHSTAKQLARNTVTQVLSRFTSQQAGVKLTQISSSPFGTDYRNLAASPSGGRSPSSGPLSPGIRSPIPPNSEKTYPPPIPPKRPGMSPTPGSPSHSPRTSLFPELTENTNSVGQEGGKKPDLVSSSSS